jgi:hypothetical protein
MLPLTKDYKFQRLSFITSFCLPRADLEKEEHIIKLLCIDGADRETIVFVTFPRNKKCFAKHAFSYILDAWINQMTPWEKKSC